MLKKWFLVGAILLLVSLPIGGCGVAQEKYNALVSDLSELQGKLQSAETEVTSLQAELNIAQSELEATKDELETEQNKVSELTSSLEKAETDYAALIEEKEALQSDYTSINNELTRIKNVYPAKDFSSRRELEDWLLANDVLEKPITSTAEAWFGRALEVQEDALADGYVASVDYDGPDEEGGYLIFCTTIIDGYIWYWDPETDEVFQDFSLPRVE